MREKFFLPTTIAACIIVFVAWQQFFYETTQREILSVELETRRLREIEREIVELKSRHENLAAFAQAKELELDAARKFLPSTLAQDKFIDELYRAAEIYQVRLVSAQAGEIISADNIQSQVVTVKLEANYISLLNFIRETLDGGRAVCLEKFSVEVASGNILSSELSFKIFATNLAVEQSNPQK